MSRFRRESRSTIPFRFSRPASTRNRPDCEQSTSLESHQRPLDLSITLERPRQYFPLDYAICRKPDNLQSVVT